MTAHDLTRRPVHPRARLAGIHRRPFASVGGVHELEPSDRIACIDVERCVEIDACQDRPRGVDQIARRAVTTLLQVAVLEPLQRMEAEVGIREFLAATSAFDAAQARSLDATASSHRPSCTKMCEGMCSACSASGAIGVESRRIEPARGQSRVIGRMNQVVGAARVSGVRSKDALGKGDGLGPDGTARVGWRLSQTYSENIRARGREGGRVQVVRSTFAVT